MVVSSKIVMLKSSNSNVEKSKITVLIPIVICRFYITMFLHITIVILIRLLTHFLSHVQIIFVICS